MKNNIIKVIVVLAIFVPNLVFAANLSYVPRVYLDGYAGNDSNLLGKVDVLAPIYLTANNNLFAYAQGKYAYEDRTWEDNTYTGSFGLGFRQIVKDTAVLGAYVFGDYTSSTSGHNFWVISPGIESLERYWVFRANGYFPVSKTRWVDEGWANEFGDYHYIEFTKNQQWDHWYQYYQETGPGGDAEIGRNLYMLKGILFKGFLNGYYYNMKHNDDVMGGGARFTIQPNRSLKISLRYSYNNYEHSTFMAGVQLSFYDLINDNRNNPVDIQDLQRNLFIPIERNLATIGAGSSIPVTQSDTPKDAGRRLEYDNVWFFNPDPSSVALNAADSEGSGTAEDPFRVFTIDTYNKIDPSVGKDPVRLYFAATHIFNLSSFEQYRFKLPVGWMMQGWFMRAGEKQNNRPAIGDDRPIFEGGFQLNSNISINNLRLRNISAPLDVGVKIENATNVVMHDVTIGNNNSTNGSYETGIYLDNSDLTINASQIYGYSVDDVAIGIEARNEGTYTITAKTNSLIEGKSEHNSGFGIELLPDTSNGTDINLGTITGDKTALFEGIGVDAGAGLRVGGCGLYAFTFNDVDIDTISSSTFVGYGSAGDEDYSAGGCGLYARASNVDITTISDSTFTGNGTAETGDGYYSVGGCGLYAFTFNDVDIDTISSSTFTGNGTVVNGQYSAGGCGLYTYAPSNIDINTISGSTFAGYGSAVNGQYSAGGCGLYAFTFNTNINITKIGGSTFTGDGSTGNGGYSTGGCGLYAFAYAFNKKVEITTISDSTFTGNGSAGDRNYSAGGCGLYAYAGRNINIATISDSTFAGTGSIGSGDYSTSGCGLYAYARLGTMTLGKTIGSIVNNDFRGSTDVGIWLLRGTSSIPMTVNGTSIDDAGEARAALSGWGNLFDPNPHDIKIN